MTYDHFFGILQCGRADMKSVAKTVKDHCAKEDKSFSSTEYIMRNSEGKFFNHLLMTLEEKVEFLERKRPRSKDDLQALDVWSSILKERKKRLKEIEKEEVLTWVDHYRAYIKSLFTK